MLLHHRFHNGPTFRVSAGIMAQSPTNSAEEPKFFLPMGMTRRACSRWLAGAVHFPSFLEPRKVSEQALVAVVQEAYLKGVSTRKVDDLVQAMGMTGCATSPAVEGGEG